MIDLQLQEDGTLRVVGEASIHEVSKLQQGLLAATAQPGALTSLDLAGLTALDLSGLQVLLAARRSVAGLRVHSCPAPLRQFVEQIGLAAQLF